MNINQLSKYHNLKYLFYAVLLAVISLSAFSQNKRQMTEKPCTACLDSNSLERISRFVQEKVESGDFVGAEILVCEKDKTILHFSCGWKDMDDSIPMVNNTIFNIRSMTKVFTGIGIHLLIERGKLEYDSKVSEFIPGFKNECSNEITIRHLLTHTSGLPVSIISDFDEYSSLYLMSNAIGEAGPQFKPGEHFQYSDAGADVLGAIIEVISGRSLNDFLSAHLFSALGMKDTYPVSRTTDLRNNRIASLYGGSSGKWTRFWSPHEEPYYPFTYGSQSYYSTPRDYSKLLRMLINDGRINGKTILSAETVEKILKPANTFLVNGVELPYSTGFDEMVVCHGLMSMLYCKADCNDTARVEIIGYGGSDGTFAWAWPEEELIILFFSQSRNFKNPFPFYDFENLLYQNLMSHKRGVDLTASPPSFEPYTGRYIADYQGTGNIVFEIISIKDALGIKFPGQAPLELLPSDRAGTWSFKASDLLSISFEKNDSGQVESFTFYQKTRFLKKTGPMRNDTITETKQGNYLGQYLMPSMNLELELSEINNQLYIQIGEAPPVSLSRKGETCKWVFTNEEKKYMELIHDANDAVSCLYIVDVLTARKEDN
jgi:CubicO group peptidase (beta-lactamase class C family)